MLSDVFKGGPVHPREPVVLFLCGDDVIGRAPFGRAPRLLLLLFVSLLLGFGADGARPNPSSLDLPVLDLIEAPGARYDPKPEDLVGGPLREKLGVNFDPRFMSVGKPPPPGDPAEALYGANGTAPPQFSRRQLKLQRRLRNRKKLLLVPAGKMPPEVKRLKLQLVVLPNGRRLKSRGNRKLRRKLRQFLWAYTYCPVVYVWKDLGLRFWPRWLREGHCYVRHSCSFPEGMSCKPNRSATKVLLRWHCQDWERAKYCKWIPVRYPVITGCACSC